MKIINRFSPLGLIFIAMIITALGCKKEADDPIPEFTLSYDSVAVVGGGKGLQFFAKCTNNDVTMSSVSIINPESIHYVYDSIGENYVKNASIPLQANNTAYPKQPGTWKFNLSGKSSGGSAFSYDATVAVIK
jgi:hypothetical protein